MAKQTEITAYCQSLLKPELFADYCPNGLQVSGKREIAKIVTGVSANLALIDAAIEAGADLLLVHHGFFWKGEDAILVGIKRQRIAQLIKHDINLLAYHLPLDAHAEFGNNAQLAHVLDIHVTGEFSAGETPALGRIGRLNTPLTGVQFAEKITQSLARAPLHIAGSTDQIESIAWCSGAAQDFILAAANHGVDAYLTGEVSERTVGLANELGVHFYGAGHHATERYGVQALGQHLAETFDLAHQYIDIDNPV